VGFAPVVDDHLRVRTGLGEVAGPARVVEVDLRDGDDRHRLAVDTHRVERVEYPVAVGADPRLDDRRPLGVQQVDRPVAVGVVRPLVDVAEVGTLARGDRPDVPDCHADPDARRPVSVFRRRIDGYLSPSVAATP